MHALRSCRITWFGLLFAVSGLIIVSPGAARAQWTNLTNPLPPGLLSTCLLLTDGTVMCHQYNTNQWHRLTPDSFGTYGNGTWAATAPMPNGTDTSGCAPCTYTPVYYASAVLPDGRLVVVGGEYNSNGNTWTNIGFLYDPVADAWSTQLVVPFGTGDVGDTQTVVLDDGTMLIANISNRNLAGFNTNTLTFTALNPMNKQGINDEENWNILPDGRVLTVDTRIAGQFEIYNPATNTWTFGPTPVNLADCCGAADGVGNSSESGPGVLRPDGSLVYFSGNSRGQNAVYDTVTGTWTHNPSMDFPQVPGQTYHFAVADGPASLLPNGNVLVMASPVRNGSPFNTPSHFYEFDGTNLTQVADTPNAASFRSYQGRMLLLPSGEVLLTANDQTATQDVLLYSNGGSPQDAWRPTVTAAPSAVTAGNTYPISGRLFNGFSEGASYGDDASMSSNYPLVRIKNLATSHVVYARTHDHTSMGVELVGSIAVVTTQFDVPAGLEPGPSELIVVVNGIPSLPVIVNKETTTTVQPASQDYHDDVTLTATVAPAGAPGSVKFFVDGSLVGTGSYNSGTGVATLVYNVAVAPGNHVIRADFTSSSPNYLDSSGTNTLEVTREETTLAYSGPVVIASGLAVTLSGALLEDGVVPISGRTVTFTLGSGGSAQSCNGTTDASGIASCAINPVNQPLGPGTVKANFAGDAFYLPSSASKSVIAFAFPTRGDFVLGNKTVEGSPASVTFWDAQWSSRNALSGGGAPQAFKGFAGSPSQPACGGVWSTSPGDSSSPVPGPLPAYMGVIVASSISKSGNIISGNVAEIVVVRPNAGYDTDPGHSGTGAVVAKYCQ